MPYYLSDTQLTDALPDLTDSVIDTAAKRTAKLRAPSSAWVESVYSNVFIPGYADGAEQWAVNQTDHASGEATITVDGGADAPSVGDFFRVEFQNTWYKITAYSANIITYAANPPDYQDEAYADFPDNARIYLGTPALINQAAIFYAEAIAFRILRQDPNAEAAQAAEVQAKGILQVDDFGQAQAPPWPYSAYADDAPYSPNPRLIGMARLIR